MSWVVAIAGHSFAVGAEVGVMADGTLVAITSDVALVRGAQRAVTVDATMSGLGNTGNLDRSVERCKAVARVLLGSITNAGRAVVEIWARQALVADTADALEQKLDQDWLEGPEHLLHHSHHKWHHDGHHDREHRAS